MHFLLIAFLSTHVFFGLLNIHTNAKKGLGGVAAIGTVFVAAAVVLLINYWNA